MPSSSSLIAVAVAVLIIGMGFANFDDIIDNGSDKYLKDTIPVEKSKAGRLDKFLNNMVNGGPPKDGIPPIDKPKYVNALEGDKFLKDNDVVFGINYSNIQKAYPQKIMVWHEIVNDVIYGEKISVTYCPLTGTSIGLKGKSFAGDQLDFGTSGKLVNSNLVMYDRQTNSFWPQILGVAINGGNKAGELEWFPVYWTTWGQWKKKYPGTLVLSEATGFLRPYGNDPYGSYYEENTYYQTGGSFFPMMASSDKLPAKKVVIGIKLNNSYLAIPKDVIKQTGTIETQLGGKMVVASYDYDLDSVDVFEKGSKDPVASFDAMWFAWYAFYPETELYLR